MRPLRMFLVGLGADERAERMVDFLANNSGMDISLITFHGFAYGGRRSSPGRCMWKEKRIGVTLGETIRERGREESAAGRTRGGVWRHGTVRCRERNVQRELASLQDAPRIPWTQCRSGDVCKILKNRDLRWLEPGDPTRDPTIDWCRIAFPPAVWPSRQREWGLFSGSTPVGLLSCARARSRPSRGVGRACEAWRGPLVGTGAARRRR